MALDFIRYFSVTNDSPIGRVAQSYLVSLLRIAPVRVVSKSGQLEGSWKRYNELIMTPMTGACVSCVCTPPAAWVWDQSVPMPASNLGPQGAATDPAPEVGGVARGTQELYTPPGKTVLRNVLFMVDPPQTDAQHQTASRYEAVFAESLGACAEISRRWPDRRFAAVLLEPWGQVLTEQGHKRIREAVLGAASV